MAVSFRAASGGQSSATATSVSATQPAGAATGDLVLVAVNAKDSQTFQAVTGWTLSSQDANAATIPFTTAVYWRVLDGTESWPISFTWTGSSVKSAWNAIAFTPGAGNSMTIDGEAAVKVDTAGATTHTANSQTAVDASVCSVVIDCGRRTASSATGITVTPPASWTEPANADQTTASGTTTALAQLGAESCYRTGQSGTVTPGAATWSQTVAANVYHFLLTDPPVPTSGPPLSALAQPAGGRTAWLRPGDVQASLIQPAGAVTQQATAGLSGLGALTAAPVQTLQATASLSGTGTLTVSGVTIGTTASLSGTGTLTAAPISGAAASLSGTGTLSATVTASVAAGLSGAGTLTASGAVTGGSTGPAFVPLAQPAGLRLHLARAGHVQFSPGTFAAAVTIQATAAMSGAGTLAAVTGGSGPPLPPVNQPAGGRVHVTRPGHAQASAVQAPAGGITQATAALSGSGTLTAAGAFQAAGTMSGTGTLTAAPQLAGSAPLSGTGTLTAGPGLQATAALSGTGTLTGAPSGVAGAALSGSGNLSAAWKLSVLTSLSGSGTLTASGAGQATANLSGSGTLTGAPVMRGTANLTGLGTLTAAPVQTLQATAALSGAGTLATVWRLGVITVLSGAGTLATVVVPPFTVGALTAADMPGSALTAATAAGGAAGRTLTASDQRTGGPGG